MKDMPGTKTLNMLPKAEDYIKEKIPKKIGKIIISDEGETFYTRENEKTFHTKFGTIDTTKKEQTLRQQKFYIFEPEFIDSYKRILRVAQMPPLKDVGMIIAETGINKETKIIESGAGSGGLTCFLAQIAKKITSYEIREDYYDVVNKNLAYLEIKNVALKNEDFKKADEKEQDVLILDLPDPWNMLKTAEKVLKRGGFLVVYAPCITQTKQLVENAQDFIHIKTIELIEREWHIEGEKVRPKSQGLMHSAFLTFMRKK
jgi:tRNA (adenine57-N1/adenine58-N1)-methyltransferase